jgi:hypothetical protein
MTSSGCPVGDLGRIPCGHLSVFFEDWPKRRKLVEGRPTPDSLVVADEPIRRLDRDDLVVEPPRISRASCKILRAERKFVEVFTREVPSIRKHLGGHPLRHELVALEQLRRPRRPQLLDVPPTDTERNVAHVLDAAGDDDVVHAARDLSDCDVERLLAGATPAIDRRGGSLSRETRLQPSVARGIGHLLAELLRTADHQCVDRGRIEPRPVQELEVRPSQQQMRVDVAKGSGLGMAFADRRADCLDDDDIATTVRSAAHETRVANVMFNPILILIIVRQEPAMRQTRAFQRRPNS